jgi:hypothetical protein
MFRPKVIVIHVPLLAIVATSGPDRPQEMRDARALEYWIEVEFRGRYLASYFAAQKYLTKAFVIS